MASVKRNPFYKSATGPAKTGLVGVSALPKEDERSFILNSGLISWVMPAVLFVITGILMAYTSLPWFAMLVGTCLLAVCFSPKKLRWLLPLLLFIPVAYGRYSFWNAQVNPILPYLGQELLVTAKTDGRYLSISEPVKARVVLSSKLEIPSGLVTLKGDFALASNKRNPGGFDYARYLQQRGVSGLFYADELVSVQERLGVRDKLARGVSVGLGDRQAALMQAMTLGIRDNLDDLRDIFSASGLAHILALSGLHVGILVLALGFALSPLGLSRYPVLMLLVVGFVLTVGVSPSIFRAATMTIAALFTLWLGSGRIDVWSSLSLSAVLVLLWQPSWLFDISFQLSYLALIGILLFTEPISKFILKDAYQNLAWWHWKKFIVLSMIVSLAAQLTTLPLVASSFGTLPILSPIVNVVAIPLATVLVPLGFLAGIIGMISLTLAAFLNQLTKLFASWLIKAAELGSSLPNLVWGEVSYLGYVLFYLALLAFALYCYKLLSVKNTLFIMVTALLCSTVAAFGHDNAELIFFDVGQGDSVLIKLPNRTEILVDAGGTPFSSFDVGKRTVVPALKALGIDELELVIASHSDADHIEGLISVLEEMPVLQLAVGTWDEDKPLFQRLIETARAKNVSIIQVAKGQILYLDDASLEILNPPRKAFEDANDNSIAFVLNYKNEAKAVLMGDLPIYVEEQLAFPDVDIVMAGHHGSKTSTSDGLLKATKPETLVFSYGRNNFGHPHGVIIKTAEALGIEVRETFHEGAIRISLE